MNLGDLTVKVRAEISGLKNGLKAASAQVRNFSGNVRRAMQRSQSHFRAFAASANRHLGAFATRWARRAAMAFAAMSVASIKFAADFEHSMAMVHTMLTGRALPTLERFSQGIRQMSVQFGESTKTLAKGMYDILSASIAPAKAMQVLQAAAKAARGGFTTTAVAADALTTILNAYRMEAEQVVQVSDVMFAIVKKGKLTYQELADQIGRVASIAAIAGVSFEEVGAALATMTRAGLQMDIAATALRGVLNTFLSPTEEATEAAKQFGLEINVATLRSEGLLGILGKLKNANAEQIAAIIPNVRAMTGFAAALQDAEGMARDYEFMLSATGQAQEAFGKSTDTIAFEASQAWQGFKNVLVEVGQNVMPAVTAALTSFNDQAVRNSENVKKLGKDIGDFLREQIEGVLGLLNAAQNVRDWTGGIQGQRPTEVMPQVWTQWQALTQDMQKSVREAFESRFPETIGPDWDELYNRGYLRGQKPPTPEQRKTLAGGPWLESALNQQPEYIRRLLDSYTRAQAATAPARAARQKRESWTRQAEAWLGEPLAEPSRVAPTVVAPAATRDTSVTDKLRRRVQEEYAIIGRLTESHKRAADIVRFETAVRKEYADDMEAQRQLIQQYKKDLDRLQLAEMANQVGQSFASNFEDAVFQVKSLSDALTALASDLARLFMREYITGPIAAGIGQGLFGLIGGKNIGAMATKADTWLDTQPAFHYGTVAGASSWRNVPKGAFAGAERLHGTLAADEYPAILQRGETVTPRGGGKVTVNITNPPNVPLEAEDADLSMVGDELVAGVVLRDARVRGPIFQTMQRAGRPQA